MPKEGDRERGSAPQPACGQLRERDRERDARADLGKALCQRRGDAAVGIRAEVQHEIGVAGEALAHEAERPVGALWLFFVVAVEPRPRQLLAQCTGTGKAGRQLLPRAVFKEDDVRAGDALRAADIHEQAVRLQALDEGIDFLEYYARLLRADGTIHLKTDSKHLYAYTNEVIRRFGLPCAVSNPDIYGSGYADEVLSVKTAYEQLFLGMGLPITYTRFSLGGRREFPWFDWEEDEKPEKDNEAERGNR